jgi:hypothetical protein
VGYGEVAVKAVFESKKKGGGRGADFSVKKVFVRYNFEYQKTKKTHTNTEV